jgi:hypothetical protein
VTRDTVILPVGNCECDRPRTVAEIRRMAMCGWCEKPGLDLVDVDGLKMHVRCIVGVVGVHGLSLSTNGPGRARLCCLGPFRMKKLLTYIEARNCAVVSK